MRRKKKKHETLIRELSKAGERTILHMCNYNTQKDKREMEQK